MKKRSKQYCAQKKLIGAKTYSLKDSIKLIETIKAQYSKHKFNQSLEITFSFSKTVLTKINAAKFKIYTNLPCDNGKRLSIAILKPDSVAHSTLNMLENINIYNKNELINMLEHKQINFDILYVPKETLKDLNRYKKTLESKSIFLNEITGTVIENNKFQNFLSDIKPYLSKYSMDKYGTLTGVIGKSSFSSENLFSNLLYMINLIKKHEIIGNFIKNISLSLTMSPSIKLDLTQI